MLRNPQDTVFYQTHFHRCDILAIWLKERSLKKDCKLETLFHALFGPGRGRYNPMDNSKPSEKSSEPLLKDTCFNLLNEFESSQGSLYEKAYSELEEMLVLLKLKPGQVLSETELSKKLGIGRTPIREALRRLSMEGLVLILPRKGILVSEINPQKQLLLLETRRALEHLIAKTAAMRRTETEAEQFKLIAACLEKAAEEADDVLFMRVDAVLHKLMEEAARNEFSIRSMRMLDGLSRRFWYWHHKKTLDMPRCSKLHAKIASEIAKGHPEKAGIATQDLHDYLYKLTYSCLELEGPKFFNA